MRKTVSLLASTGAAGALILGSALPAGADPNSPNVGITGAARCPASLATGVAITTSAGESDTSGVSAGGFYSLSLQQVPSVGTVATFSVECSNGSDSFSRTRLITRPISGKVVSVNLFS
ncbi:hypothetical protein [Pseudofrankia inefficax]|nr:hypothetical protein [Pseudofrankia inefficax]